MWMALSGHQFFCTFADSFGMADAKDGTVIEEKIVQPRAKTLRKGTNAWNLFHRIEHGVNDTMKFVGKHHVQLIPPLTVSIR